MFLNLSYNIDMSNTPGVIPAGIWLIFSVSLIKSTINTDGDSGKAFPVPGSRMITEKKRQNVLITWEGV
jgi:hypothetical protein